MTEKKEEKKQIFTKLDRKIFVGLATFLTLLGGSFIYGSCYHLDKKRDAYKNEIAYVDSTFQKLEESIDTFIATDSKYFINNGDTIPSEEIVQYHEKKEQEFKEKNNYYWERSREVTNTDKDYIYYVIAGFGGLIAFPSFFWGVNEIQCIRRKEYLVKDKNDNVSDTN